VRASSAAELVREIESAVAAGSLPAGERLPSVRRLATQVGLSPATVASALAELRRRGVVLSEPRRGTRIGEAAPIGSVAATVPIPDGARELSRGNPDPTLLPDLQAALARIEMPVRLYGEPPVLGELADLARSQFAADGIAAQSICVVSGALDGIERVLAAHLRAGDSVAVENPGYAALFHLLRARGLGLEPVAIDDRGMLPAELARALAQGAKAVVITPRGQNPTGAALDGERAEQLREVLTAFPQTLVIEDDHLGQVAGAPAHSVCGSSEHWAIARSVTKALGPDLRLAILTGDGESTERVQRLQACGPGWVSHVLQRVVLELLGQKRVIRQIDHARDTYTYRREHLLRCLAGHGLHVTSRSGLNVWVPVAEESSAIATMLSRGWVLSPGLPYRLGQTPPAIRITISTLQQDEARTLAADLAGALRPSELERSG
jgi:DNA-binding transcriptional MocR family regulator